MIYQKNLRMPFVLKILSTLSREQEVRWKIIAKKFRWGKSNKEPSFLKKSTFFFSNSPNSNFQYSSSKDLLFTSCGLSPVKSTNTFRTLGHISSSARHYSQKTSNLGRNSNKWLVAFILSGSAGVAVYKTFYHDQESGGFAGTDSPIIDHKKTFKSPSLPENIPDEVPYLIIGGGTAAFAAFRAIKSSDPTAKILVVTNESHYPYMRPPLTKELIFNKSNEEGDGDFSFIQWNGKKRSVFFEPEEFYISCEELSSSEYGGVAVARGWKVKQLNHNDKEAVLEGGKVIKYDKCLLATGSYPKHLHVFSKQDSDLLKKVLYYRYLDDFLKLEKIVDEKATVAVIGGGFSGTELAGSLSRKGVKVIQILKEEHLLDNILPKYFAKLVTQKLKEGGVNIINNTNVIKAELVNNKVCLTTANGHVVTTDHVIVASGVIPNTTLAKGAGIEVDKNIGGYVVNAEFEVRRDLYAAGDCASYYDDKFGRRRIEHHDHAVLSGRIAGENMTGKGKTLKTQSMFWCDVATELGFEAVGIVDSSLPTVAVCLQDSDTETEKPQPVELGNSTQPAEFNQAVVFYLKNNIVVGMVLWNLYNRVSIARRVLKSDVVFEDLREVAKHFKIS